MEPSATTNASLAKLRSEWLPSLGWTVTALLTVSIIESLVNHVSEWRLGYTFTGGHGDCMGVGSGEADVAVGIAQLVAVYMYGRTEPKSFWTGIVIIEFIRYAPAAVLIIWLGVSKPSAVGSLLDSVFFWWPLRGAFATVAFAWLCLKAERWHSLAVTGAASLILLGALSALRAEHYFDPGFPARTEDLWGWLAW